jgi:hypothetical protein
MNLSLVSSALSEILCAFDEGRLQYRFRILESHLSKQISSIGTFVPH